MKNKLQTTASITRLLMSVVVGLVFLPALAVVAYTTFDPFNSSLSRGDIIDEETEPEPAEVPELVLDRLRQSWNSDTVANWPVSDTLADISDIAYLNGSEAEKRYHELGFSHVTQIAQGSMVGYVLCEEDITVVAFRGTDDVSDWLVNLGINATDTPHGPIHSGFFYAYQSMKLQIDAALAQCNTKHLWITGHSLGGALALLCAYDQQEFENRPVSGLITFGQPMVAKQSFADHIDSAMAGKYARYVNRSDIVPKVPPLHVPCGSLVWFTDDGVKRSRPRQQMMRAFSTFSSRAAMPEESIEIEAMSLEEFEKIKAELQAGENMAMGMSSMRSSGVMSYRVNIPPLIHHGIGQYLQHIQTLLGIKLSQSESLHSDLNLK